MHWEGLYRGWTLPSELGLMDSADSLAPATSHLQWNRRRIEALQRELDAAGGPEDARAKATLRYLLEIAAAPRRARELSADAHCWSITAPTPRRINPEACEKELLPAFHSARMDPASLVDVAETPEGIGFAIGPPEAGRDARSRRCV